MFATNQQFSLNDNYSELITDDYKRDINNDGLQTIKKNVICGQNTENIFIPPTNLIKLTEKNSYLIHESIENGNSFEYTSSQDDKVSRDNIDEPNVKTASDEINVDGELLSTNVDKHKKGDDGCFTNDDNYVKADELCFEHEYRQVDKLNDDNDDDKIKNVVAYRKTLGLLNYVNLKQWQKDVLDILNKKSDGKIHWYWNDKTINSDEINLARLICCDYDNVFYTYGAGNGAINACKLFVDNCNADNFIFILDTTKTFTHKNIYKTITVLKNGLWSFKGKTVLIPLPHILVFAPFPPDTKKLSNAEYNVVYIDK